MVENIDTEQAHTKKKTKISNFIRIWTDSSILHNFNGYSYNPISNDITNLNNTFSSPVKIINNTILSYQNVPENQPRLNYCKTPSPFNQHKYNRLERNNFTEIYPTIISEIDTTDTKVILPLKSNNENLFQQKYNFYDIISDLEKDLNLRNQFIICLKKSTILSKSIMASICPVKDIHNRIFDPQYLGVAKDEKLQNSSNVLPPLNTERWKSKKFLFGPTESSIKFKRPMSYAIQENERVNDSLSSPAISPTHSTHSTQNEYELDNQSTAEQAFDISSKRIEDELQRQLQSLNLNQQKLDMTLIKYQTETKSGLDLISPSPEKLTKPERAKAAVSDKLNKAVSSICGNFQEIFSEILDEDLVYLAKYTSNPVLVETYPPLSLEDQNKFERVLHYGPKDEILVRGFGADIKRSDLNTLEHINWLNDEIMNFYLNMITERSKSKDEPTLQCTTFPSVHSFSTFFFTQLSTKGYQSVKRWTKKVDIFDKELIIVPVHIGAHWCLGIIDNVAKVIIYFDSLYSEPHNFYLEILLNYLQEESLDKKKTEFDTSDWKLINALNVPQQKNGSDCGMFALKYAEFFSRRENFTFSQAHMSYFRQRMVLEIVNKKLSPH